jgi:hypothetical protein
MWLQQPRDRYGATVVCIERQGRLRTELLDPSDDTELRAGDVGLIEVRLDPAIDPASAYESLGLEPLPLRGSYFTDHSRAVGMAEILVPPDSILIACGGTGLPPKIRPQCDRVAPRHEGAGGLVSRGKAQSG